MIRTDVITAAFLAVLLGLATSPPAAARGLDGGFRVFFMKTYAEGCMKAAMADSDMSKLPRAKLVSLCRCSGQYIAAHATAGQLDKTNSPAMLAIEAQAARACLPR